MKTILATLHHTRNIARCPLGRIAELVQLPDASLYLVKPGKGVFDDYQLIRFASRAALEAFNVKAQLRPLVFTIVPKGCAVHKHQREQENVQSVEQRIANHVAHYTMPGEFVTKNSPV